MTASNLQSLRYTSSPPKMEVLDQLLIPHAKEYIDVPNVEAAWSVIRKMQIRGT
jgi:methylthioribose-1-phosphate isomerase